MSLDAIAPLSALPGLPEVALGPLEAPGGPAGAAVAGGGGALLTPDAALPTLGLAGASLATEVTGLAHAERVAGGSAADELAAGGQMRGLTEMARELSRGGPALRGAEDAVAPPSRAEAGGTAAETLLAQAAAGPAAPAASVLPGLVAALHPGTAERLRPASEDVPPGTHRARERERGGRGFTQESQASQEDDPGQGGGDGQDRPAREPRPPAAEPSPDAPWCAPLMAALLVAARKPAARPALEAAAEAWVHGRAVLLACPAAAAGDEDAWLFVLRPAHGPGPLRLCGERLAARLRWARVGGTGRWCLVRVAKSYSLRRGGQLVTQDEGADGRVSCELQLGPFPSVLPRWREVLVRVDLAQRLWQALGTQWSLPLLVCDQPLLGGQWPAEAAGERRAWR